jgi:flavodoxin
MKVLVTYWSQTGNTLKIAEVIYESLSCEKVLKPFDEVEKLDGYDLMFIGFPIMQFGPPPVAKKFIAAHANGKNIALFVTHATPSNSSDPAQQAMLAKELEKCKAICSHANFLGIYHCQGELSEKISNELLESGIPMLMEFASMRPSTLGHPNTEEMKLAAEFAVKIQKEITS